MKLCKLVDFDKAEKFISGCLIDIHLQGLWVKMDLNKLINAQLVKVVFLIGPNFF